MSSLKYVVCYGVEVKSETDERADRDDSTLQKLTTNCIGVCKARIEGRSHMHSLLAHVRNTVNHGLCKAGSDFADSTNASFYSGLRVWWQSTHHPTQERIPSIFLSVYRRGESRFYRRHPIKLLKITDSDECIKTE